MFDNDGTLWAEQPAYFQLLFAVDRVRVLAPQHPEWKTQEPFALVLKGDMAAALTGGNHAIMEIVAAAHAGVSTDAFQAIVKDWLATARHPTTHRPYTEMIYQPMVEVLRYLRANGFKTFIVSGGTIGSIRAVSRFAPSRTLGSPLQPAPPSTATKTSGFRGVRPVIKLADGSMSVGDVSSENVAMMAVSEFPVASVRWMKLDPMRMVTLGSPGPFNQIWVTPDMSKVDEVGFADLIPGSGHGTGGWVHVGSIEVYGKAVPRGPN